MDARRYKIGNMDCAGCAREVESAVGKLDGVRGARVDFLGSTLHVIGDVEFAQLREQVEAVGKTISAGDDAATEIDASQRTGALGFWDYLLSRPASRLALIGGALLLVAIAADVLRLLPSEFGNLLYALAMLVAMKPIAESGLKALRVNREFNINMLMTIAAVGALFLGEFLEAATVIFLFAIGEALEGYTADRARDSLRSLIALKPPTALRIAGDRTEIVPVERLRVGELIRVLPGERIPMGWRGDGGAERGRSSAYHWRELARPQGARRRRLRRLDQWRGGARIARQQDRERQHAQPHHRHAAERAIAAGAQSTAD